MLDNNYLVPLHYVYFAIKEQGTKLKTNIFIVHFSDQQECILNVLNQRLNLLTITRDKTVKRMTWNTAQPVRPVDRRTLYSSNENAVHNEWRQTRSLVLIKERDRWQYGLWSSLITVILSRPPAYSRSCSVTELSFSSNVTSRELFTSLYCSRIYCDDNLHDKALQSYTFYTDGWKMFVPASHLFQPFPCLLLCLSSHQNFCNIRITWSLCRMFRTKLYYREQNTYEYMCLKIKFSRKYLGLRMKLYNLHITVRVHAVA